MLWFWVFSAIFLVGLISLISHAVWLWHKTSDLISEFSMLGTRMSELGELLGSVRSVDEHRMSPDPARRGIERETT